MAAETPLDTALIDSMTGGINAPRAAEAGGVARANSSGTNIEYVVTQSVTGTNTWNGSSEVVLVHGAGARQITLKNGFFLGQRVTLIDADGTAAAGNITAVPTAGGSLEGSAVISTNYDSRTYVYIGTGHWARLAG